MSKNRLFEIKIVPWDTPHDLTEESYADVLRSWASIMRNSYVGILKMDPKSICIDRKKVSLLIIS